MNWTRVVMDQATHELVSNLPYSKLEAMEISGDKWKSFGFRNYTSQTYPDFDICDDSVPTKTWDIIIAEQVFEHLLWPYRAGKNVYRLLNPKGYFLVTTPFLLPVHDCPVDCSRWTETGLKYFLAECGFPLEAVHTGSWGNERCVKANFHRWKPYSRWFHSLRNSQRHPVVVWALARKT
jgi:hypothetical protein